MRVGSLALVMVALLATTVWAQPPTAGEPPPAALPDGSAVRSTSDVLRDGNAAASMGDWPRVTILVDPLVRARRGQLAPADLAEAHRLAGIAAYFQQRTADADGHFLAYLKLDLDGRLDPAMYPPEVVTFFQDVQTRHSAELRARRPKPRRYFLLSVLPPAGQFQNGERTKGFIIGGLLGAFAVGNITTYLVLRSWCTRVSGGGGQSATCDEETDRSSKASQLRTLNIVSGLGLIATYIYGAYDGVSGYRRRSRERSMQPFATSTSGGGVFGIAGSF